MAAPHWPAAAPKAANALFPKVWKRNSRAIQKPEKKAAPLNPARLPSHEIDLSEIRPAPNSGGIRSGQANRDKSHRPLSDSQCDKRAGGTGFGNCHNQKTRPRPSEIPCPTLDTGEFPPQSTSNHQRLSHCRRGQTGNFNSQPKDSGK